MTSEELAAIRARLDAASPRPWRGDCESGSVRRAVLDATKRLVIYGSDHDGDPYYGIHEPDGQDYAPNAALIVNAPTDLAALLDEVARLAAEVERLNADLDVVSAGLAEAMAEIGRMGAMVPRWRRTDYSDGSSELWLVVGKSPPNSVDGTMVFGSRRGEACPTYDFTMRPDIPTACAAVCERLGLPYIAPPENT